MIALPDDRPAVMGILNVTPDSFSDGGSFNSLTGAIDHALKLMDEGADLIDVGGESTRPNAEPVSEAEELKRVLPIVESLAKRGLPVSIDTYKPGVAQAAIDAGAALVNDVTGLRNPKMIEVVAESACGVCIMHMQGTPQTMQKNPVYGDVVRDVREYLFHAASLAEEAEIPRSRIWIDPGIGFGKTIQHNLTLLNRLEELVKLPYPVLVGVSRKGFIGKLLGTAEKPLEVDDRLEGTLTCQLIAQLKGARIIRCHDVLASRRAIEMAKSISLS
jgi:dihydropteroate synthase